MNIASGTPIYSTACTTFLAATLMALCSGCQTTGENSKRSMASTPQSSETSIPISFSRDCPTPLFHWTTSPILMSGVNTYINQNVVGAVESTRLIWNPDGSGHDLAGEGLYLAGEPFSSQSYGDHLLVLNLKPHSAEIDLSTNGMLDDGISAPARAAIRSDAGMIVHSWASKLGRAEAVVLRAKQGGNLSSLPVDLSSIEIVDVPQGAAVPW